MTEIQLGLLIAAILFGPAGAMGVGLHWLAKDADKRDERLDKRFDQVEAKLDKIDGNVDRHGEKLATHAAVLSAHAAVLSALPCSDPEYRRRAYTRREDL